MSSNPTPLDPQEWIDPRFAPLDTRSGASSLRDALVAIAQEEPERYAEFAQPQASSEPTPAPAPIPAVAAAEPELEPEAKVIQNPDGSSIELDKTSRGWRATLLTHPGAQPEVFYGATKNEMWTNVAAGKLNATKKIRELNRKVKLGVGVSPESPSSSGAPVPQGNNLTAEQRVQINLLYATDPAAAMEKLIELRTGKPLTEIARDSGEGRDAKRDLILDQVSREFLQNYPGYFACDPNYTAMIGYLAKQKLNRVLTPANQGALLSTLVDAGHYTVDNLGDAFEELSDSGLLEVAAVAPRSAAPAPASEPAPVPAAAAPAPVPPVSLPPTDERIVRVERRPRAGFGLRGNEVSSPTPQVPDKPPSAEELSSLSDAEFQALWAATRKAHAGVRRS